MPDHAYIYEHETERYDMLISKQPELYEAVNAICPVEGLDIVDTGAGTGRLAAALAPYARSVTALDASEAMLRITAEKLTRTGLSPARRRCMAADNRRLPLPDRSADLVVSGWSVCYQASSNRPDWQANLASVLNEFKRVLRPGGTIILFETMGTGTEVPAPPAFLMGYYRELRERYGFAERTIRLDYTFGDWREAAALMRFFFGGSLADRVEQERLSVVPEVAGIWWLTV